eukprot:2055485-Rhodomonas_salina.3
MPSSSFLPLKCPTDLSPSASLPIPLFRLRGSLPISRVPPSAPLSPVLSVQLKLTIKSGCVRTQIHALAGQGGSAIGPSLPAVPRPRPDARAWVGPRVLGGHALCYEGTSCCRKPLCQGQDDDE